MKKDSSGTVEISGAKESWSEEPGSLTESPATEMLETEESTLEKMADGSSDGKAGSAANWKIKVKTAISSGLAEREIIRVSGP